MNRWFWKGVMVVLFIMLGVLGLSFTVVEPGSADYVITVLAAIHVLVGMALVGAMLYFEWDPFEPLR